MRLYLAVALLLGMAVASAHADDDSLVGSAKVRGPEMLVVSGTRVRLSGVLPPEESSRCLDADGATATCTEAGAAALARLIGDAPVTCVKERRLGHGYYLGHCHTADGTDPAKALLELGLLQADPAAASDAYRQASTAAQAARIGLWGS
jgi:endonuclease YncB( thermonuclease family)